jgi:hypothetical protein
MSDHVFDRPTLFAAPPCVARPAATTYAQFAARAARSHPEDFADDFGRSVLRECYDDVSVLDAHRPSAYAAAEATALARVRARRARAARVSAARDWAPSERAAPRAALADTRMGREVEDEDEGGID